MSFMRRNSGQDPRYEAFRAKGGTLSYTTAVTLSKKQQDSARLTGTRYDT